MTDTIKVVYPDMEQMSRTFHKGGEQLEEVKKEMLAIAKQMEDGALLGQGGQAFVEAIRTKLAPAIDRLAHKFHEEEADIKNFVSIARRMENETKGYFKN